jgi:phosphate transport system protein
MTRLEEELKILKESLAEMAGLVKQQLKKSVDSLLNTDDDLATEVLYNEKRVNAFELKIDRDCERIFTLQNPMANDMRLVFSTLKINADLERIGDYAEGIAKLVLLGERSFDKKLITNIGLERMYPAALLMMDNVVTAYCDSDTDIARSVLSKDAVLNEINRNASNITEDYITKNLDKIQQALLLLSIVRKLERVGDHITNIAEEVIFFKEAKVLKHIDKKDESQDL